MKCVVRKPAIPTGGCRTGLVLSASLVVRKWGACPVRGSRP